ncbi:MAG: putative ABC transport system permease protein, partial [Verrucomicrobiales bacterium]
MWFQNGKFALMTRWKLALNSLKHYRWLNIAVIAGVAVTSAILSGALVVGDSVKESLRQNGAARISKADFALVGGDRFFTVDLANRLGAKIDATVAPLLQTLGTAAKPDGTKRANNVQIVGVTPHFWGLATGDAPELAEGEVAVNETLAETLGIGVGDSFIAKVELPGLLSKDAVLSGASNEPPSTTRAKVARVVGPAQFGRYLLNAEQIPVPTVFFPIDEVQELMEKPGFANVILIGESESDFAETVDAIGASWTLADAAISIKEIEAGGWRVSSGRVFVDKRMEKAVREIYPKAEGVLTYLVNTLRAVDQDPVKRETGTPYSMVASTTWSESRLFPADFKDDEIIISDWLQEDLGVAIGDKIAIDFFVMGNARRLEEKPATFTVRGVLPIENDSINRDWTPDFPGVADADSTRDWEPGMPLDLDRILDNDEKFWEEHRTTPKAFISLAAGQKSWVTESVEHRFGRLTGLLIPSDSIESVETFESALREKIGLGELGFVARNLRAESAAAVTDSYDFGMLFASMSGFLIIAALILTALVFVFGIEQRRNQIGLLLALGMPKGKIRGAFLMEALVLAIVGASLGLAAGAIYTKLALSGLGGAWQGAATGIEFVYSASMNSLGVSWVGTVFLALIVVWISTFAVSRIQPSQLISGSDSTQNPKRLKFWFWASVATCLLCVIGAVVLLSLQFQGAAMIKQLKFFGAGFLLVVAGLGFASAVLTRMQLRDFGVTSIGALGRANAVRRKGRSIAVVTLMASGVFMVTAINSLRLSGQNDAGLRSSGTGGFEFIGEATLPIYDDLNTDAGREQFGISAKANAANDFEVVQFRVSQGDDASCLNLNRAQQPKVLGVAPEALAERGSFFFSKTIDPESDELKELASPWQLLNDKRPSEPVISDSGSESIQAGFTPVIPGVIDEATATYAL